MANNQNDKQNPGSQNQPKTGQQAGQQQRQPGQQGQNRDQKTHGGQSDQKKRPQE